MDKLFERIQKLLNLAGNNMNEAEAASAIAKAHAILAEHNLTMSQVQAHKATTGNAEDAERGALDTETNFSEKQFRWIWSTVADAHYCKTLYMRPNPKMRRTIFTLVGRKINALVASQMAMYLCQTVQRLANQAAKDAGRKDNAFKNAFIAGCAARLCQRVRELRYGTEAQQNALVLWTGDEDKANEAFVAETYGKDLAVRKDRESAYDAAGARAGRKAGDGISLAQQVERAEQQKQIG